MGHRYHGRAANNKGVVLGTFVFVMLRRVIDFYKLQLEQFVPFSVVWLHSLLIGLLLIIVLMFRPEGILREKPTSTLNLERFKKQKTTDPTSTITGGNLLQKIRVSLENAIDKVRSRFFNKDTSKPD